MINKLATKIKGKDFCSKGDTIYYCFIAIKKNAIQCRPYRAYVYSAFSYFVALTDYAVQFRPFRACVFVFRVSVALSDYAE